MLQPPGSEDGISAVLLAASNPPAKVVWTSSISSDEDIAFTHCLHQHLSLQTKHLAQPYPNAGIVVVVVIIIIIIIISSLSVCVCVSEKADLLCMTFRCWAYVRVGTALAEQESPAQLPSS